MLTGDTRPSSGTALITGHDITTDIRKVRLPYSLKVFLFTLVLGSTTNWILSTGKIYSIIFKLLGDFFYVQFDALIDDLTAYELLWLYARLRGIPEKKIKDAVDTEIKRLDLLKHADRLCGTYR